MKTEIITADTSRAAEIVKGGGLLAVPTETVYGLAANGLDGEAVKKIYEVKGRPDVKPLSLMVAGREAMDAYCEDVPAAAYALADAFWPGPLTIIMKSRGIVPEIVRAGGSTVGLRCPDHPLTLDVLRRSGLPLAAPSANPSGQPSPKTAQKVAEYFDGKIDAILDGGECGIGTESTIIDLSAPEGRILRKGALSEVEINAALTDSITLVGITGGTGCGKTTAL
ncbi:MAG: threonylcarbamoyl-AMP synthase [Clostridia bacterium]|nr:threonylcarbamoyl-AMP synthase [Clostridia bacterium]